MTKKVGAVLVIGSGVGGIRAALDLAESSFQVYLVDKSTGIGGTLAQLDKWFPDNQCELCKLLPVFNRGECSQSCLRRDLAHPNIELIPGAYVITYNEIVHLPRNVMALSAPRSSLLRCGVAVHNAVWDAGYSGRAQSLLVVYNQSGFRLQRNARVVQLVFFRLTQETDGYQGVYQRENI